MPYDGNPAEYIETKPDVYSLEGLIAWLEQQPGDTTYVYVESSACLLTRYFETHGIRNNLGWRYGDKSLAPGGPLVSVANRTPWTYAAALDRARELAGAS